jgi:hypothetical protein
MVTESTRYGDPQSAFHVAREEEPSVDSRGSAGHRHLFTAGRSLAVAGRMAIMPSDAET